MVGLVGWFDTAAAEQSKMSWMKSIRLIRDVSSERQGHLTFFCVNDERNWIEATQAPFC